MLFGATSQALYNLQHKVTQRSAGLLAKRLRLELQCGAQRFTVFVTRLSLPRRTLSSSMFQSSPKRDDGIGRVVNGCYTFAPLRVDVL